MPGQLSERTWLHNPALNAPPKYRRACSYSAFVPDLLASLAVPVNATVAGVVSEAERAIGELNDTGVVATLAPLARLLLRTESIASSKVEGMQLGARALARAEAQKDEGRPAGQAALEILANIDAMILAVEEAVATERFGVTEILAIHHLLMKGAENRHVAGRIRTEQNWIGGNDYNPCDADFVPPPPEEVSRLLDDLCVAINDDLLPPIIQAALVHAQFETIHPFHDGNGRTGRALVQVVLRRRGIAPAYVPPISVALASAKDRYIAGLTKFRANGVGEWIEFFADASWRAARLAKEYLSAVRRLDTDWRARLEALPDAPRAGAAAWAIIDALPAHPVVTAPVIAAATGRARAAVYAAIRQLERAGVLMPLSTGKRNRSWEVAGLIDLIEGFESGVRPPAGEK